MTSSEKKAVVVPPKPEERKKFPDVGSYWAPERVSNYLRIAKIMETCIYEGGEMPSPRDLLTWEWVASNTAIIMWEEMKPK